MVAKPEAGVVPPVAIKATVQSPREPLTAQSMPVTGATAVLMCGADLRALVCDDWPVTWFLDLSPCTYNRWSGDRLAVGWLEADHPFDTGRVSPLEREEIFLDRLFWAAQHRPVEKFRGFHTCQLCTPTGSLCSGPQTAERHGESISMGSAHIAVSASDGGAHLIAPNLIYHYITEHAYTPPDVFVDAVILGEIQCETPPAGELVYTGAADLVAEDPAVAELVLAELAARLGSSPSAVGRCVTVTVRPAERVLVSIPERLPAFALWLEVRGPIFRRGWTEWAPTGRATTAAVERLFSRDPKFRDALEIALAS